MDAATATVLVTALANMAEKLMQGTALLAKTRAEGRDPSPQELLELDVLDDQERQRFQQKIDDARAREQAERGVQAGDVPMKVGGAKPASK
jgi:hypothetical protein